MSLCLINPVNIPLYHETHTDNSSETAISGNMSDDRKQYSNCFQFGSEETNRKSLYNWIKYTDILYKSALSGSNEDKLELIMKMDRAKRRLELIDFYVDDKDPKSCLLGIWAIVSTFDREEKHLLLSAYNEKSDMISYEPQLIKMLESLEVRNFIF